MKKILLALPTLLVAALPLVASAHEHDTFVINGTPYTFTIGSLNEPVAVDDKSGLDLTVTKGTATTPVTGLETSLTLELVAGGAKKTFAISPQYGAPGKYTAAFYPTVATTFSYHLTGTVDSTPIDLTFTCVPEGTPKAADDTSTVKLSDTVTRTLHAGAFGCPTDKGSLGFPENSASIRELAGRRDTASMVLGAAALALAVIALVRSRRS
jgi:hypothetical protein